MITAEGATGALETFSKTGIIFFKFRDEIMA